MGRGSAGRAGEEDWLSPRRGSRGVSARSVRRSRSQCPRSGGDSLLQTRSVGEGLARACRSAEIGRLPPRGTQCGYRRCTACRGSLKSPFCSRNGSVAQGEHRPGRRVGKPTSAADSSSSSVHRALVARPGRARAGQPSRSAASKTGAPSMTVARTRASPIAPRPRAGRGRHRTPWAPASRPSRPTRYAASPAGSIAR